MRFASLLPLLFLVICASVLAQETEYRPLVFAHYMPWYQSKEYSGYWGWHWTMNNRNPDRVLDDGRREIASHFYPLIGPYDSSDPVLIDYHLLLMQLSGIDGLFIDWYGTHQVYDYPVIRTAVERLVSRIAETDLLYAIVYEERTIEPVAQKTGRDPVEIVLEDLDYLARGFFGSPNYLRVEGRPVLLVFGPLTDSSEELWTGVRERLAEDVLLVVLNYGNRRNRRGEYFADGEFGWVDTPARTLRWYNYSRRFPFRIGPVLPGYKDFYPQGGVGPSLNSVDYLDGGTFREFLDLATTERPPILQLITWNDFGEGTCIEPTREWGYRYLIDMQEFTRVPYGREDLELARRLYELRKQADEAKEGDLVQAVRLALMGDLETARLLVDRWGAYSAQTDH